MENDTAVYFDFQYGDIKSRKTSISIKEIESVIKILCKS